MSSGGIYIPGGGRSTTVRRLSRSVLTPPAPKSLFLARRPLQGRFQRGNAARDVDAATSPFPPRACAARSLQFVIPGVDLTNKGGAV